MKQEYIEELKSNIKMLKSKSEHNETDMRILRRENRQLWKQVTVLTEQYSKQQVVLQQVWISLVYIQYINYLKLNCRFIFCSLAIKA